MKLIRIIAIGIALIGLAASAAYADSLYSTDEDDAYSVGLYGKHDPIIEVGDIVKVKIVEKTSADVELSVDTKDSYQKSSKIEKGAEKLLGRVLQPFFNLLGSGEFSHDTQTQFKDDGKTDREVRLDALVTALVVEKLPTGNLVIEGRKQVLVNSETQTLLVRGVIDPKMLDADNVIESADIADVEIEYVGEGQLSKRTKPGFLSRVIEFIF
jgi:flagellar L-ring protein precursor FlgH